MKTWRAALLSAALLLFALGSLTASAATLTDCTEAGLRAALASGGTIEFGCNTTIPTTQILNITRDTTLDARGRTILLNGLGSTRVLQVNPGVTLRLINITVTNGYARDGAALYNDSGIVTAENCTFSANQAFVTGGAIFNSGTLTLTQCVLVQNVARGADGLDGVAGRDGGLFCNPPPAGPGTPGQPGGNAFGGAIYNAASATALVVNCTIESSAALAGRGGNGGNGGANPCGPMPLAGPGGTGGIAQGGGIYNLGQLSIVGSTLSDNSARGGDGGRSGLANFPGNLVGAPGGYARGGAVANLFLLSVTNSTIAENVTVGGAGADTVCPSVGCYGPELAAHGGDADGGIFNSLMLVAHNVTIWNNEAHGGVGGLSTNRYPPSSGPSGRSVASLSSSNGTTILLNTIIGNLNSSSNCVGVITDGGYNICSDTSAGFTNSTSRNATDPRLASLSNNGGFTKTIALLGDSPALDQGDPNNCLPTDQRGVARPAGSACDIGAYEGTALQLPVWTPAFTPVTVDPGGISRFAFTLHNPNPVALTQVVFTNSFPPGFVVAPVPNQNSDYQGALFAFAGQSRILGVINTLPAGHSCHVAVDVRAVYPGVWDNNSLQIRCAQTGHSSLPGDSALTITGGAADCNGQWICRFPNGSVKVRLPVTAGATLVLSASHDLQTWTPLMTNSGPGLLEYLDQSAPGTPARFFRAH